MTQRIIEALHSNTCPECHHHVMAAEYLGGKHWVCCYFCVTRWEISKATKEESVRICDTLTFKTEHGQL